MQDKTTDYGYFESLDFLFISNKQVPSLALYRITNFQLQQIGDSKALVARIIVYPNDIDKKLFRISFMEHSKSWKGTATSKKRELYVALAEETFKIVSEK
ncbi:hypothetical protein CQA66_02355 [Helicobacter aurati]|uniref:Cds6 C-terminal domain-containing protein n=1 Tax=Helicobacter aurati TaxID=137778 RepID=A0A3D8J730_9HELI|nr:hypothetical protein [Helicobacter aurati]RDU73090.1 hypothetical protein CQA66_02355 [Helicobacter aurati]